jgi:hypothetical protein
MRVPYPLFNNSSSPTTGSVGKSPGIIPGAFIFPLPAPSPKFKTFFCREYEHSHLPKLGYLSLMISVTQYPKFADLRPIPPVFLFTLPGRLSIFLSWEFEAVKLPVANYEERPVSLLPDLPLWDHTRDRIKKHTPKRIF